MHILSIGAAGMVGRKLTARLVADGRLAGREISRMTLADVVAPEQPAGAGFPVETATADLGEPGVAGDYKPGIAALYRELDLPVHPVATNSGVHWPRHGFLRKPGLIVFEYLEPIPPGLKRAEFMRILEERIETASNRLLDL